MSYFDVKLKGVEEPERFEVEDGDLAAAVTQAEKTWGPSQIEKVTHALVCRSCGSSEIKEWEDVPYYNYVTILGPNEDGTVDVSWDGPSGSGDGGGGNTEYWCASCEDSADSLEELVGLPLVVNTACPLCGSTELSAKISWSRRFPVSVGPDGEVEFDGFGARDIEMQEGLEEKVEYLVCENEHLPYQLPHQFQPTAHRLPVAATPVQATKEDPNE